MRKVRFHVASCSGEDPSGPVALLNEHDHAGTGYLTPKNCEYPQELAIELESIARVTQIQVLSHQCYIATKIELYLSLDGITYQRLGFLSLKSNKESQYTARELKTVHIDAVTRYIKFKMHQCYINEKNLYSQVGIVAININGDVQDDEQQQEVELDSMSHVHQPLPAAPTPNRSVTKAKTQVKEPAPATTEDMRFDAKTAAKIREVHLAKEKAVAMEDYDQAKRLKALEDQLKSIGLQLARLETAKREAVENEDYDAAKNIKDEIARLEAELTLGGTPAKTQSKPIETFRREDSLSSSFSSVSSRSNGHIETEYPPAIPVQSNTIARRTVVAESQEQPISPLRSSSAQSVRQDNFDDVNETKLPNKSKALPSNGRGNSHFEGLPDCEELDDPEPLPSALEKESQEMIDVIGLYLTQCFYSNLWNHRDAAIRKVTMDLNEYDHSPDMVLQVLSVLVQSGIGDRISQVSISALGLCEAMLVYAQDHIDGIHGGSLITAFSNPIVQLVNKLGEPQSKIREQVSSVLLKLAGSEEIGADNIGGHLCRRTTKKALAIKHLQGRLGLVKELLVQFGVQNEEFTLPIIMGFLEDNSAFSHQTKEIRDLAKDITVLLHEIGGSEVEPFLKSLRPKQLEEYQTAFENTSAKKVAPTKGATKQSKQTKQTKIEEDLGSDTDSNASVGDGTCPFCDEHDESFDNERLDQHFWAECPMLNQCKMCGQVIEISTLNEHLLVECELKQNHKECPRCHEAITVKYFEQHRSQNDCDPIPAPNKGSRCPLCHEDIPPRKRGWKSHLLHDKCPQNPRTNH
ncbi:hypothetical protein THRCLA_11199 [Thraustotheca clavata]|uniref:TOG domain-containing protein n=1 Tax=Thraustotheca clavata TaxID=74557 RepID=A0A1V9Y8I1_9STRA|nr:hypothetical protein THRCLA_11199 [Thraustotheca clavata]